MRDIEFRAWNNETKSFIYTSGAYVVYENYMCENEYGDLIRLTYLELPEQYTGLKDKNGTKIFEGDRVRLDLNNLGFVNAVVIFRCGCYVFDTPHNTYTIWESDVLEEHIEVIGNVHEG